MISALIYISRELSNLIQCWARKIIQLEEKNSKRTRFEDQSQLDDLAIEIVNRSEEKIQYKKIKSTRGSKVKSLDKMLKKINKSENL